MKRLAAEKESWEEFEKCVGNKRNNAKKPGMGKVPSDILVQRMSPTALGRLIKYMSHWTPETSFHLKIMKNPI